MSNKKTEIRVLLVTKEILDQEKKHEDNKEILIQQLSLLKKELAELEREINREFLSFGNSYIGDPTILTNIARLDEKKAAITSIIEYLQLLIMPLADRAAYLIDKYNIGAKLEKEEQKEMTDKSKSSVTVNPIIPTNILLKTIEDEDELESFAQRMRENLSNREKRLENIDNDVPICKKETKRDNDLEEDEDEKLYKQSLKIPESPETSDDDLSKEDYRELIGQPK